jgi:hypothetical protein
MYSSHTTTYEWGDGSEAGLKAPVSKGPHPIIVHPGNIMYLHLILLKLTQRCYPHFWGREHGFVLNAV